MCVGAAAGGVGAGVWACGSTGGGTVTVFRIFSTVGVPGVVRDDGKLELAAPRGSSGGSLLWPGPVVASWRITGF
ncbi:MAG: hypothetical protein M0P73_11475, partial [Syntrophobacterales bacterium]|nr:hypothetical protein [Syntrophobacterales bacterium]